MPRRRRLPTVETGQKTGHCFVASMLAHVNAVDFDKHQVAVEDIRSVRQRAGVKITGYVGGTEQQRIADALGVGYVFCTTDETGAVRAARYTSSMQGAVYVGYAMLAFGGNNHTVAVATRGGKKCGLLTYDEVVAFLADFGATLPDPMDTTVIEL